MTKLIPVTLVLWALAAATAVGLASPAFSQDMPRVKGHHRVYKYSPQTSAPTAPGGSAYGLIYGGYGGEPYSGHERWGGFGPDGDYGPGRP
jgi:hypothetical protein